MHFKYKGLIILAFFFWMKSVSAADLCGICLEQIEDLKQISPDVGFTSDGSKQACAHTEKSHVYCQLSFIFSKKIGLDFYNFFNSSDFQEESLGLCPFCRSCTDSHDKISYTKECLTYVFEGISTKKIPINQGLQSFLLSFSEKLIEIISFSKQDNHMRLFYTHFFEDISSSILSSEFSEFINEDIYTKKLDPHSSLLIISIYHLLLQEKIAQAESSNNSLLIRSLKLQRKTNLFHLIRRIPELDNGSNLNVLNNILNFILEDIVKLYERVIPADKEEMLSPDLFYASQKLNSYALSFMIPEIKTYLSQFKVSQITISKHYLLIQRIYYYLSCYLIDKAINKEKDEVLLQKSLEHLGYVLSSLRYCVFKIKFPEDKYFDEVLNLLELIGREVECFKDYLDQFDSHETYDERAEFHTFCLSEISGYLFSDTEYCSSIFNSEMISLEIKECFYEMIFHLADENTSMMCFLQNRLIYCLFTLDLPTVDKEELLYKILDFLDQFDLDLDSDSDSDSDSEYSSIKADILSMIIDLFIDLLNDSNLDQTFFMLVKQEIKKRPILYMPRSKTSKFRKNIEYLRSMVESQDETLEKQEDSKACLKKLCL